MRSPLASSILVVGLLLNAPAILAADRPNIVVILTDDQGYADVSLNPHHAEEVSTPHIDALAEKGVSFSNAYTSGPVCSPTRAGLMLGRYQQRVGVYVGPVGRPGFDPDLPIFPSFLPPDYRSTAIGKWHLGGDEDYPKLRWHALNRGFDECYKFMGESHKRASSHDYFNLRRNSQVKGRQPIYRNWKRINDRGYLTDRLTEEAVDFIDRNKRSPFFLYLAYNAVHAPAQAPRSTIAVYRKKYPKLSKRRVVLMAMLKHLDDGVGTVVAKLEKERLFDNTLLFFLTDNGGTKTMAADNSPLRGFKGTLLEGGIRTPLIVSWPDRFKGGRSLETPVISIDILPTAIEATGAETPTNPPMDGKSLLPLLTGSGETHHETIYWDMGPKRDEWAVRQGKWKLRSVKGTQRLSDLAADPSEGRNLLEQNRTLVQHLTRLHAAWRNEMEVTYLSARSAKAERKRKQEQRRQGPRSRRKQK